MDQTGKGGRVPLVLGSKDIVGRAPLDLVLRASPRKESRNELVACEVWQKVQRPVKYLCIKGPY